MLFEGSAHVHEILLQVALGHSLSGSQSCFAVLSKDIFEHALATAIEESYWDVKLQRGLLTPPPAPQLRVSPVIPLPNQSIGRAVARPAATVYRSLHPSSSALAPSNSQCWVMLGSVCKPAQSAHAALAAILPRSSPRTERGELKGTLDSVLDAVDKRLKFRTPFLLNNDIPADLSLFASSIDPQLDDVGKNQEKARKLEVIVNSSTRLSAIDMLGNLREMLGPRDAENPVVGYLNDTDALSMSRWGNNSSLSEGQTRHEVRSTRDRYHRDSPAAGACAIALRAEAGLTNLHLHLLGDEDLVIQTRVRTIQKTTESPAPVVSSAETSLASRDSRPAMPPSPAALVPLPLFLLPLPVPLPSGTLPRTRIHDSPLSIPAGPAFTARPRSPWPSPLPPASGNSDRKTGGEGSGGGKGAGGLKRFKVDHAWGGGGSSGPAATGHACGGGASDEVRGCARGLSGRGGGPGR
jgi:hypothetical protein